MRAQPEVPAELEQGAPPALGSLVPVLDQLARAQGAWPPTVPQRVVVAPPADGWDAGAAVADRLVDEGADLLVVRGGGDRGPALALLAVLLHLEPVAAVGTSATPGWPVLVATVRDGLRASKAHLGDPEAIVVALAAGAVAGLAGTLAQAAVRRTPALLSGAADVVAAAVLAERVAPGTSAWLLAGCSPPAGGAAEGLAELQLGPVVDLRLPGAEGADLALPLLLSAVELARAT